MYAPLQPVSTTRSTSAGSRAGPLLQRKCACGGSGVKFGGQCPECERKKQLGLQRRMSVGRADDALEREADEVARMVLTKPTHNLGAMHVHAPAVNAPPLRRLPSAAAVVAAEAPPSVGRTLASPGRPLEPMLRRDMENRFGIDFSQVRVHTDAQAARSAQDLSAHAFTAGRHIAFADGRYAPGTATGRELLAHELTHVVQQATPGTPTLMRKGFESTVEVCHRVLESRHFQVENGGVRVVLAAQRADTSVPDCREFDFGVTLTHSRDWWPDKEIGTCESRSGGIRVFKFADIPSGTYYLTFWRNFDHPYCCLNGDVFVYDEAQKSDGEGCRRAKDLSTMDIVHGALDLAGFIPVLGAIPDGINAGIYAIQGDWANAGLSAVAALPAVGDSIKAGTMFGKAVIKVEAKTAIRLGEEGLATELKELKAASKATSEAEKEGAKAVSEAEKEGAKATKAEKKGTAAAEKEEKKAAEKEAKEKKKEEPEKEKERKPRKPRCTQAEIEAENLALHVFCNKPRSCSMQGDTCATATAKVAAGNGCVAGRIALQQRCFRKGDPGYEKHMQQIAQASAALRNCEAVMMAKCK